MSFLDEVRDAESRPGPRCSFSQPLALSDADRADLDKVLADVTVRPSAISKALQARGIPIKQQTVARHRRRDCSCP